jgi:precorrin-6Y C5,15-methyltransferase (decarboxylating)
MSDWLSIIGIGEDGADGLGKASRDALSQAEVVFGGPRHLDMIEHGDKRAWPVPFSIAPVLALRGRRVAVLASGDPFWHGAGASLTAVLAAGEWRAFPVASVFSLACARKGWRLEEVMCIGLHATAFARLRPHLVAGARIIATLRDGAAVSALAGWLVEQDFGASIITVMERLGGPAERIHACRADAPMPTEIAALVCVGIEVAGEGPVLACCTGRSDDLFEHDGQITKRPVRALALSALAPRPGEMLWDIGAGSGSIGIEWLLCHPRNRCIGIEADDKRAARARANAARLGLDRLELRQGRILDLLTDLAAEQPRPQAVFVGGGCDEALLGALWACLPAGARLVVHAVTLETEALLASWHGARGGQLLRIELADAAPLGRKRGWRSHYPVVQWSVTR